MSRSTLTLQMEKQGAKMENGLLLTKEQLSSVKSEKKSFNSDCRDNLYHTFLLPLSPVEAIYHVRQEKQWRLI